MRISREQYFMQITQKTAELSTSGPKAGCVLVYDKRIMAMGYNQVHMPRRLLHTYTKGDRYIHAIVIALMVCRDIGQIDQIYVTETPCIDCIQMLMKTQAQIIYYNKPGLNHKHIKEIWKWSNPKRAMERR